MSPLRRAVVLFSAGAGVAAMLQTGSLPSVSYGLDLRAPSLLDVLGEGGPKPPQASRLSLTLPRIQRPGGDHSHFR